MYKKDWKTILSLYIYIIAHVLEFSTEEKKTWTLLK